MSRGVASTSRRTALKLLGAGLASVGVSRVSAFETVERNDLITLFVAAGVVGCFAVFDPSREGIILVNGPRARRRFPPGHTVEIVQGLIAAEVGVYKFDSATLRSNNRIISERWKSTHIGTLENINDSFPLSAWKAK